MYSVQCTVYSIVWYYTVCVSECQKNGNALSKRMWGLGRAVRKPGTAG